MITQYTQLQSIGADRLEEVIQETDDTICKNTTKLIKENKSYYGDGVRWKRSKKIYPIIEGED